jgi:hypothetical protein
MANLGNSKRQYKTRITKWKLEKNIKDVEMDAIAQKQIKRKSQEGKESAFRVRSRPVPQYKIRRYTKNKNVTESVFLSRSSSGPGKFPIFKAGVSLFLLSQTSYSLRYQLLYAIS